MNENTRQGSWQLDGAIRDPQSITREWIPVGQPFIDGVVLHEIKPVIAGYGHLVEIVRAEWLGPTPHIDQIFQATLTPGAVSAWHAHEHTTDRFFVLAGTARVVLFDRRHDSPTAGVVNEFRLGALRPALLVVPPRIWHGVKNVGHDPMCLLNVVDRAYEYDAPDHWRVPMDHPDVPYRF